MEDKKNKKRRNKMTDLGSHVSTYLHHFRVSGEKKD